MGSGNVCAGERRQWRRRLRRRGRWLGEQKGQARESETDAVVPERAKVVGCMARGDPLDVRLRHLTGSTPCLVNHSMVMPRVPFSIPISQEATTYPCSLSQFPVIT
jgi:hypothetical protein